MNNGPDRPSVLGMGSGHIEGAWLSGFRDGELGPARREEVADHLKSCGLCQRRLADLAALSQLLRLQRTELEAELPKNFTEGVMGLLPALPASPASDDARSPWARLVAFAQEQRQKLMLGLLVAAAAAALVVVFMPGLRAPNDNPAEAVENEAQIHSLEVTSPESPDSGAAEHAIVLQSSEGNTVIWLLSPAVDDSALDAGASAPAPPSR